jgi:hypothetical protein
MRHVPTLVSIALLTAACGAGANRSPADTSGIGDHDKLSAKKAHHLAKKGDDGKLWIASSDPYASESTASVERPRPKLGDFHVFRYGGSFSKRPVTLTEQVTLVEDDGAFTKDFVMEDGAKTTALRVSMRPDGEVTNVVRRAPEGEVAATAADFERMMRRIQFVPDTNDEVLSSDDTTCMVGTEEVSCQVTKYRVTVGKKQATLSITRSDKLPGGDLGGEIVTSSGKVLYSAHLVEQGNDAPGKKGLASLDHRLSP